MDKQQTTNSAMTVSRNPFRINWHDHAQGFGGSLSRLFDRTLEQVSGLGRLAKLYDAIQLENPRKSPGEFASRVLAEFGISWRLTLGSLETIPTAGPVIIVANHPFGAAEGLILFDLLSQVRPDVKIFANFLIQRIDELQPQVIAADPFGGVNTRAQNVMACRAAIEWLSQDGLLAMFPSGTVSHLHPKQWRVMDPAWSDTAVRFAHSHRATVVPIYFHGQNSQLFQCAGLLHPRLRTALLPRELLGKRGWELSVAVGNSIGPRRLDGFPNRQRATDYLRLRTYLLNPSQTDLKANQVGSSVRSSIVTRSDVGLLTQEINAIDRGRVLLSKGAFNFYCVSADEIPHTLAEIGRLREESFREAGEGTGQAVDLDRFDTTYLHLFAWNRERREVAGAYRLAHADQVVEDQGLDGIYTHSLFRFGANFLPQLGTALEMGRSFVSLGYQRSPEVLLGLWQSIGEYVWRNPRVRTLFGPASISRHYGNLSRQIIVDFLRRKLLRQDLAPFVQAIHAYRDLPLPGLLAEHLQCLESISDIDEILQEIEHKSMPVLLKHYLKLGAEAIAFGVDPNFSDSVDVLIAVDILQTDLLRIERFMGKSRAVEYLKLHGVHVPSRILAPPGSIVEPAARLNRQPVR